MFLTVVPPQRLAFVYLLVAAVSLVAAAVNGRIVKRLGERAALTLTLGAASTGTLLLYLLPKTQSVLFLLYVWSSLLGVLLTTQFWMYAGHRFTIAEAKRLFAPIAAGGVLGGVAGTAIAASAIRFAPLGALLVVSAAAFSCVAFLVRGDGRPRTRAALGA